MLAQAVIDNHTQLNVLINNAGVFKTTAPRTQDGLDVRFAVNTLAPYLLTQKLLPLLGRSGRVINLSSAGQSPVDAEALAGRVANREAIQAAGSGVRQHHRATDHACHPETDGRALMGHQGAFEQALSESIDLIERQFHDCLLRDFTFVVLL
jgi:NAD(P)-dependent dehydrogenase (short-subunit alcohol dehydrogenase family)